MKQNATYIGKGEMQIFITNFAFIEICNNSLYKETFTLILNVSHACP